MTKLVFQQRTISFSGLWISDVTYLEFCEFLWYLLLLHEHLPNTEFFLVCIFCMQTDYEDLPCKYAYSILIQENTAWKNPAIWPFLQSVSLFTKNRTSNLFFNVFQQFHLCLCLKLGLFLR